MDGEEMDDKQIHHISNWESDCISTDQYNTIWNKIPQIFPNIEPLCSLEKCPMSRPCISICLPVPSIVVGAP